MSRLNHTDTRNESCHCLKKNEEVMLLEVMGIGAAIDVALNKRNSVWKKEVEGRESDQKKVKMMKDEVKEVWFKTTSKVSDDEDETKITDKIEGDEDEEMDYTTSLVYNDVDIRLNEPVQADDKTVQEEGTDATMTNVQQGNENLEIVQVIEDAHMTLSTVPQQTEVPVTSSSHSSDLVAKFLNFLDIPHEDAEIVSLMDVHVHHEVPIQQTPTFITVLVSVISDSSLVFSTVIPQSLPSFTPPPQQSTSTPPPTTEANSTPLHFMISPSVLSKFNNRVTTLEKEVAELKKDSLHTQVTALVDDHLDTRREPEYGWLQIRNMTTRKRGNWVKIDEEPRRRLIKSDWFTKPTQLKESYLILIGMTFDELMSTLIEFSAFIMNGLKINNLTQKTLLGPVFRLLKGTRSNYAELEYDFEECYKALSEKLDSENPEGGDYSFDLTKPLPLVMSRNHQKVPVDYFFNNNLKYLLGGILTMTYTTSLTKTKAAQYDLPGIEDMNRLTNLSGDDISDFAIELRMFIRSLVIQKRVKDLQLMIESYQKKIKVTKPETTKSGIRKKDPYTPYQDHQGFIYVDNNRRNRLMRSDELYKFSDRTLIGL
ncbi:hypothetical protein Tco_1310946 [Tanacetum coccineum]